MYRTENHELEGRYQRYREILKNLTIMSDIFMRNVFKNRDCIEYVLRVILKMPGLTVVEQIVQKDYKNLQGRSAIMDCVVRDAEGKQFDVEIQQENEGASPKRARFHSGLMDMNTLNPGEEFDKLPETYVIFITRQDVLGFGLPIYHIERKITEVNRSFQDEAHIVYVNASCQEDTELGNLIHDLHCSRAEEMYSGILARRVQELKETPEGVDTMCREMDAIYNEGEKRGEVRGVVRGIEIGELKAKREMALSLAQRALPAEEIAQIVKMDMEQVRQWLAEGSAAAQ